MRERDYLEDPGVDWRKILTFGTGIIFLILAHPVYKM